MNTTDRIKQAKSLQEAVLVLAQTLDRIEAKLDVELDTTEWGTWSTTAPTESQAPAPALGAPTASASDDDLADLDPALRDEVIAARQRLAADRGGIVEEQRAAPLTVSETAERLEIQLPGVDADKRERRRKFADVSLKLQQAFPEWAKEFDVLTAYAKGGPLWLYLQEDGRDLILQYPRAVRQQMVDDVMEDDPQAAHDLARDILAERGEEQTTIMEIAKEAL